MRHAEWCTALWVHIEVHPVHTAPVTLVVQLGDYTKLPSNFRIFGGLLQARKLQSKMVSYLSNLPDLTGPSFDRHVSDTNKRLICIKQVSAEGVSMHAITPHCHSEHEGFEHSCPPICDITAFNLMSEALAHHACSLLLLSVPSTPGVYQSYDPFTSLVRHRDLHSDDINIISHRVILYGISIVACISIQGVSKFVWVAYVDHFYKKNPKINSFCPLTFYE